MQKLLAKNHRLKISLKEFFDRCYVAQYNKNMISEQDKAVVLGLARKYGVKGVILFGSSAQPDRQAKDIDIGIEGIAPEKFFEFYGKLIRSLSKPVDVVDLSEDTKFNRLIYRDGIRLYG